ncbi:MAG: nitroreductase family protein [Bacteroidales bacterium]|nr:nitroreductase family protein [Bacteroidales bacterium]MBQ5864096.1 nitroreductase family protein [Bacteroidales bacterium]
MKDIKDTLYINSNSCIKCNRCAEVCPAHIMQQTPNGISIGAANDCIKCGHCVAACPTGAFEHSSFPAGKVHKIDYSTYPSAEQLETLINSRRSNRAFTTEEIPLDMLKKILEAAHRAPTASNMQQVEFTLVTNKETLHQISAYTLNIFSKLEKKLTNPFLKPILKRIIPGVYRYVPKFKAMREEFEKGNDLILRGATAVIFIHTPKENRFGRDDANLAYQNGSLMAQALGISQFYTGFVCTAIRQDKKEGLAKMLGINGTIHAGMALGLPKFKFPNYIDKKELVVKMLL